MASRRRNPSLELRPVAGTPSNVSDTAVLASGENAKRIYPELARHWRQVVPDLRRSMRTALRAISNAN
jgi:hypothetical protein